MGSSLADLKEKTDRVASAFYHKADYRIAFEVSGQPIPKGRPEWSGKTRGMRTPDRTVEYEKMIAQHSQLAHAAFGHVGRVGGPVAVRLHFILKRPKRLCKRTDPDGMIPAPVRPDADNLTKAVMDGMKRIWVDDAQVCWALVTKEYAEKVTRTEARAVVWVWSL